MRSLDRPPRSKARSPIILALRLCGFLATLALTGCQPNVLDPQGQVGRGDATILINSVAIMLAIVVPTIVATLAFAWWFRASNTRAVHLPDFEYSGQVEMITWAIPILTIMLLGGVAWIGSHELDPAKPLAVEGRSGSTFRSSRSTGNGCSSIRPSRSPASTGSSFPPALPYTSA